MAWETICISSGVIIRLRDYKNDIFGRIGVHCDTSGYKNGTSGPEKKAKKKRVKCLGQYGQEKSFKVVLTNLNAYQKTNHRNNNANFKGKMAKNHDFDARGVWRP